MGSVEQSYFTYRVTKVPPEIDLYNLFCSDVKQAITDTSIGPCPYNPNTITATVTFKGKNRPEGLIKQEIEQVQIDDNFYGLTPLNTVAGSPKVDIVAITGLAGRAFGSWQNQDGKMWLRDFLAPKHTDCRFFTYGYPSKVRLSQSQANLSDFVENFVKELRLIKPKAKESSPPLILIGHSLGCIIIKDAIVRSTSWLKPPPRLYQSVCGIVYFGAPHRGLNNPELEQLLQGTPPDDLLRDLGPNSFLLSSLNQAFQEACEDIKIISCYETERTYTYKLQDPSDPQSEWIKTGPFRFMVPPISACLYWSDSRETKIAICQDHSGIAKLSDASGSEYHLIEPEINELINAAPDVMKKRRSIELAPQSILCLLFMLQYEYHWFRAWSSHAFRDLLPHGNDTNASAGASEFLHIFNRLNGHPLRSLVAKPVSTMEKLDSLVSRHRVKYDSHKHRDRSRLVVPSEAGSSAQTYLRFASVQFSQDPTDKSDFPKSGLTNNNDVYQLEDWSRSDQEEFAFQLSKFRDENKQLSRLSPHAASIGLLASSKVINIPDRTPQDLKNIEKIFCNESQYTSLSKRASTRWQHMDVEAKNYDRVPEFPLSEIPPKNGSGCSQYRVLLPNQVWTWVEWMKYPFPINTDQKDILKNQVRRLAGELRFSNKPLLLKTLQCAGLVEDLDQHSFGLLFNLPSWIDSTREPATLYSLLQSPVSNPASTSLPSLDERLELARSLTYSIAELHIAGVLHKNIHCANLKIFPRRFTNKTSLSDAFICGLEFSRPIGNAMVSTTVDPGYWDMYRHPELRDSSNDLQGRPSFRPRYDVYALGLVLLEIGLWKRLEEYFKAEDTPAESTQKFIRLASKNLPFYVGTDYCEAVLDCLDSDRQMQALESASHGGEDQDHDALFLDFFIKTIIPRLEK